MPGRNSGRRGTIATALLIVNRRARQGEAAAEAARAALEAAGLAVAPFTPPEGMSCADAIRVGLAAHAVDRIVIGGGDGTLNAAIPALLEAGLPFGILPLGTANDLARSLGIPFELEAAAQVVAHGAVRPLDIGEVNGHPFFNVASIGFSAELAQELKAEAKRRFGRLGYAIAAFRLLRRARPFTAWLTHDGVRERVKTVQVSVGNGKHHGGGMTVAEAARPDDGVLDVYSLEVRHWWRLVALLPWLRRGTQGQWREVRAFRTTALELRTRRPRPVNTDGEITAWTPARFRVRPGVLRVVAP
ncbi:lipid kinase [Siccirubricoccus sp. KC 17139]|uniref:Lipid kinase n=1 Tax=Siccirubricoccus soli TaxID=2899147 RepID=A0ABT1DC18_9PROT|nr:lipid kinase [Siccirubricoccus soli]MCO6419480.1 lipid kinase [Siccirubricoccus soli]MCP2685615.1 lipid kinase [Siccirubricoccus soli]